MTPSAPSGQGWRWSAVASLGAGRRAARVPKIGIATGLVVVGELVGDAEARDGRWSAKRQTLPRACSSWLDLRNRRRRWHASPLGSLFELTDLGPRNLHGISAPVRAWRVLGEGTAESRFEALRGEAVGALIGRETELALLLDRWHLARTGDGQVVLLSGEPGIGKSRLILALREHTRAEPRIRLSYACSPHHTQQRLWPVIQQLERAAGFHPVTLSSRSSAEARGAARASGRRASRAGVLPRTVARAVGRRPLFGARGHAAAAQGGTFAALMAQLEGWLVGSPSC